MTDCTPWKHEHIGFIGATQWAQQRCSHTRREDVVGQSGGAGNLHQEDPEPQREVKQRGRRAGISPGVWPPPVVSREARQASQDIEHISEQARAVRLGTIAHTTANLPPKESRLPHPILLTRLLSGGPPSPQPRPVGMALTLHLSVHLFSGSCADPQPPPQVAMLHEGTSLTKTRAGLETGCCRYFLRCPQLMPGKSGHSLKWAHWPCAV